MRFTASRSLVTSATVGVLLAVACTGAGDPAGDDGNDGTGGNTTGVDGGPPGTGGSISGTGGNISGTGGTGTGGTVTGTGGTTGGTGGSGTGGTGECTPTVSRCDCVVHADGVSQVIDSFEDSDMRINVIDGRDGEWFQARTHAGDEPIGTMVIEDTTGGAPGSTKAMHITGGPSTVTPATGEPDDWATFGVPLGQCYDASPYSGFSFWLKGNPGAGNDSVRFSISTPPTTEVSSGGTCPDGDLGCYNHFGEASLMNGEWQKVTFTWDKLKQGNWGIKVPDGYPKEQNILAINFAPLENTKGYDFWIDDVQLTTESGGSCADVISEAQFNQFFPNRNAAFYDYAGFAEASRQWSGFCGEGSEDDRKRDAAAFLANVFHETGGLVHMEEIACAGGGCDYCDESRTDFPCAAGKYYHGRGAMQLSWNYNYGTAGQALGLPLLTNPELVSASSANAFKAGLWFWMTRQPLISPHTQIVTGKGFGETIRLVNGPLECDGKEPAKVQSRIDKYTEYCGILGVDPGGNLGC